ncbi:MAG: murein L,D-transpeptidase [Verrucomicrobiaceae bacterium]|nr:murein L,D-transpeptidase [Verrucomicrobiaceae bacterium]
MTGEQRLADLHSRRTAGVTAALQAQGFALGNAVFLRAIKEGSELELWLRPSTSSAFNLYKKWPIARWSGTLGPKTKEGDHQAPEGFYAFDSKQLNPRSSYHLSFNIGYPNALDQALGRTGSLIMIHGKDVSIGCFAMTDPVIEEIYLIVEAALAAGQPHIDVHCFPFHMTAERMSAVVGIHRDFWLNLKEGWDRFELTHLPPTWTIQDGRYHFD